MKNCALYIMMAICLACGKTEPSAQPIQFEMSANIGKMAYNATNGMEIGRIVGVTTRDAFGLKDQFPNQWLYRIERNGRIINFPPANVTVNPSP
jgi:hypothetical protein